METGFKMKIYEYKTCSTCKKALKFLNEKEVDYDKIDIAANPPSKAELKKMLSYYDGNIKKLLNTSGQVYRQMGLKDKLADMTDDDVISLLNQDGKLVKRPFLLGDDYGFVGFKEELWSEKI